MKLIIRNLFVLGTAELSTLQQRIAEMSDVLNQLIDRVTEIENVADSAIELIAGLKAQLDEAIANNDLAALQELSDRLGAQSQELADAILAHTPGGEVPAE